MPLAVVGENPNIVFGLGSKRTQWLGVDFTPQAITVAQVKRQGNTTKLIHLATTPMPAGGMADGRILDPPSVGLALQDLLAEQKIKTNKLAVATAIPGREATLRILRLPAGLSDADMEAVILEQEASVVIPFPLNEVDLDYQPLGIELGADGTEQQEVLLVATPKDTVDTYLETIAAASLELQCVELASFALIRSIRNQVVSFARQEAIAIANIGYDATEMTVILGGVPQFARTIQIGVSTMQDTLGRALNIAPGTTDALLYQIKLPLADAGGPRTTGNPGSVAVSRTLNELADELQRSIDFFTTQNTSTPITQLFLAGRGATVKDIDAYLGQLVGCSVSLIDPLADLALPANFDGEQFPPPAVGVAIGLGLREDP
ncbi:MAG: type IV pilus assembly protein PilM [Synechococcaceae cyanobacterium SM2_3_60]|nr:type IV pilus assembly protein PilM [Synechococcaceae cyanobacterium SM2_3_60]